MPPAATKPSATSTAPRASTACRPRPDPPRTAPPLSTIRNLYAAVNRRLVAFATTSGSGSATTSGSGGTDEPAAVSTSSGTCSRRGVDAFWSIASPREILHHALPPALLNNLSRFRCRGAVGRGGLTENETGTYYRYRSLAKGRSPVFGGIPWSSQSPEPNPSHS